MTGRVNPLPGLTGLGRNALPGLISPETSSSSSYAMSTNPFDINYTVAGEVTYSETNHRATFGNSQAVTSVARLLTGYGYGNRAIEFESVVFVGGTQGVGLRPALTQNTTDTQLQDGTGDVAYRSSGSIFISGVEVVTTGITWTQGDKIGVIYRASAGTVGFFKNGASVYTTTGISGDFIPAAQQSNNNSGSLRVSTSWSFGSLPSDVLYWR